MEEAERKVKEEAEKLKKREEEMRMEAERKLREEERRFKEEADRRVKEQLYLEEVKAKVEHEKKLREETEMKLRDETEKKLKAEADKKLEEERRFKEEADRRVKEQLHLEDVKAKVEHEKKLREDAEMKLKETEKKEIEAKKLDEQKKSKEEDAMKLIYEKRLEDLKAKLAEAEKRVEDAKMKTKEAMAPVPPKVSIYTTADTEAKAREIKTFLLEKGIKDEEIQIMNGSGNIELMSVVKQQRGDKFQFPVAIINNTIVGNIDEIKAYNVEGLLDDIIAGKKALLPGKKETAPSELQIGFLDGTINVAEWTIYGLGTLVLLPVLAPYKLISWAFGSKKPEVEAGVDIDVIHTNWYNRHQLRTFRFTEENVFRLRPGYNDVRAVHKYEEIALLDRVDATNLIISYKDKSSPDYIRAPPTDIKRIRDIVMKNSKSKPYLKGWDD